MNESPDLSIEKTLRFDAPPERVWRAITEPAELGELAAHLAAA